MKNFTTIAIALLLVQCEPIVPQNSIVQKKIIFDDYEYEDIVGNVEIGPIQRGRPSFLENPVISINDAKTLILTFDLLTDQFENLSAKIFHCNKDWNRSQLRDMEYLAEINNFRITEFDYSVNTIQPYINYRMKVPKPTLTGNYVIAIFRRSNPNDILFTRKFLVVSTTTSIDHLVRMSTTIDSREENHQIEFSLNYGNLFVNAPTRDISPVILQNHDWKTMISGMNPTLIRANEGFMEYRYLDLTTNFPGWNEFRFTDLRTLNVSGRNVGKINTTSDKIIAQVGIDKKRNGYNQQFEDINGEFIIQNNDPGESSLNADYAYVQFFLESEKVNGDVYVNGRFNNWRLENRNKMRYDAKNGRYFTSLFLKQGYYEYNYYLESSQLPPYHFEGSHFLAENQYEIIVYYRRPGNINDEIVGYRNFRSR